MSKNKKDSQNKENKDQLNKQSNNKTESDREDDNNEEVKDDRNLNNSSFNGDMKQFHLYLIDRLTEAKLNKVKNLIKL